MAKLYYRYGSMNAGKSTALLQAAFNYEECGKKVSLFTAAIDNRMGFGVIGSRIGLKREALVFCKETFFEPPMFRNVACVLIDEAQFLTEQQVKQLHWLANVGEVPVLCYGIRSDFRGNAFEGSAALLTLADDLQELKTVCRCGKKASMNMRVGPTGLRLLDGEQIGIGGNELYLQVCPACFYKAGS